MTILAKRQPTPSVQDAALARGSARSLARVVRENHPLTLKVTDAEREQSIELPPRPKRYPATTEILAAARDFGFLRITISIS
jgi:hypothetical protein